jgi:hypothetical protein
MKRIVVLGGSGFFGRIIVERLTAAGLQPLAASRSSGALRIDANSPEQLKANLRQRDLVIDAAGPFQARTPALIEAAAKIGFDVIDLSDSADYTAMVYAHQAPIASAGIRILSACSAVSTVSAAVLKMSGIDDPRRLSAYILPASRYTANRGSVRSFLHGVMGRSRSIRFPAPIGTRSGVLIKSVDWVTLPPDFKSLYVTELIVDSGSAVGNLVLPSKSVRDLLLRYEPAILRLAKRFGNSSGILGFEIASTLRHRRHVFTGEKTYLLAVLPAIEAARQIAGGKYPHRGIVPPTKHVDPFELFEAIKREGINTVSS